MAEREMAALVRSRTEKQGKQGPFWILELVEGGQEKGLSYSLFDHETGDAIKVGETYRFTTSTKDNPKGGVYRNVDKVLGKIDMPPGIATVGEVYGGGTSTEGQASNASGQGDSRERSIERQVALKEARLAAEWFITSLDPETRNVKTESLTDAFGFFSDIISQFYFTFVGLLTIKIEPAPSQTGPASKSPAEGHEGPRVESRSTTASLVTPPKTPSSGPDATAAGALEGGKDGEVPDFQTFAELYSWAWAKKKLTKSQVFQAFGVKDDSGIIPKYGSLKTAGEALLKGAK